MFLSSLWPPILHTSSPLQCSDESVRYSMRSMYRYCQHHCFVFVLGSFSQQFSFVIYGTIWIVLYFYEVMEGSVVVGGVRGSGQKNVIFSNGPKIVSE